MLQGSPFLRVASHLAIAALSLPAALLAADRPPPLRPSARLRQPAPRSADKALSNKWAAAKREFDARRRAAQQPPAAASKIIPASAAFEAEPQPALPPAGGVPQTIDVPHVDALQAIAVTPIDLATALSLVDVQNPQFLLSQQRVVEAVALRQLAAVQILPTINLGTNYDGHTGNLQQSSGNILAVKRNALFVGAGANAIAAGSVNIPGVLWSFNVSEAIYNYLGSQQLITEREFASTAARNEMGLRVAITYLDLLEAEAARSIAVQVQGEAAEVARITAAYAKTGQGRQADAQRAATELRDREANILQREGDAFLASARLAQLLSLESSMRLHATDNWIVPHPIVPDPIPLPELLAIAILQRPELQEQQAAVQRALISLDSAEMLPFSPTMLVGFSAGTFGGGSNLVTAPTGTTTFGRSEPRFGAFHGRADFDVVTYWTLRNLTVGNKAMIEAARSRFRAADLQKIVVFDRVRADVAKAHSRTHARFAEIGTAEEAVRAASDSWTEDLTRIRAKEGLPIEVLDSLRLLARAREEYMRAIVEYNRAQFELYVALGQPPAEMLARPAGAAGVEVPAPPADE